MTEIIISPDSSPEDVLPQLHLLLEGNDPPLTLMANTASLFYWSIEAINWIGFYLLKGDTLHLGPFHGKPACSEIAVGEGVCGAAVEGKRLINARDVNTFSGHVVCDLATRSELVVPLFVNGVVSGVLDVDSPVHNRFGIAEEKLFQHTADLVGEHLATWGGRLFPY